jgi:hypothetical protein
MDERHILVRPIQTMKTHDFFLYFQDLVRENIVVQKVFRVDLNAGTATGIEI